AQTRLEFHGPAKKVGMHVSFEDVPDVQSVLPSQPQVLVHIAGGVDHRGLARLLIADQIRIDRQSRLESLMEIHGSSPDSKPAPQVKTCRQPPARSRQGCHDGAVRSKNADAKCLPRRIIDRSRWETF